MAQKHKIANRLRFDIQNLLQRYETDRFKAICDICSCIEALFMHQLRGNFHSCQTNKVSSWCDQPSFWNFLKSVVPKHLLDSATDTHFRRTYVGRCRAWIRYCLNEASLHSYLIMIKNDTNLIRRFYHRSAILNDDSILTEVISLLEILEELRFKLDLNSPLLNGWGNSNALELLGLVLPSKQTAEAFDELDKVNDDLSLFPTVSESVSDEVNDQSSQIHYPTGSRHNLTNMENDVFVQAASTPVPGAHPSTSRKRRRNRNNRIVTSPSPNSNSTFQQNESQSQSQPLSAPSVSSSSTPVQNASFNNRLELLYPIGSNNLLRQACLTWIEPFDCSLQTHVSSCSHDSARNFSSDLQIINKTVGDNEGNDTGSSYFDEQCEEYSKSESSNCDQELNLPDDSSWDMVGEDLLVTLTDQDVKRLVEIFPGSSTFNYAGGDNCVFHGRCYRCQRYLEPNTSFLDYYDANFYCMNCHQLQEAVIPRDVIFNWDFTLKPVSQPTCSFLSGLHMEPVINLAKLNPTLYAIIPSLLTVRQLRRALIHLWHQISRCDANVASYLRRCFYPRVYMLQSLHDLDLFSLADLMQVKSGELEKTFIDSIKNVALAHVHECRACRRRALICDLCERLDKPIWPHEFTTYKRCVTPGCSNVMHSACLRVTSRESPIPVRGCLECRALNSTDETNSFKSMNHQCRACQLYSAPPSKYALGHYADPFVSQ